MIEQLFGSKTRAKLLFMFFQFPNRSFYVREMAREIGSQLNAVRREIDNLKKLGIICLLSPGEISIRDQTGHIPNARAKYYQLDTGSLLYSELKSLLLKTRILKEREMVEEIKKKAGSIELLILTGIFTDAKDVSTDMLVVGRVKPVVLDKLLKSFGKKFGKDLRYTVMSQKEFRERKELGDRFLYSIFDAKHLVAVDEL